MTEAIDNYGKVMFQLGISKEVVDETRNILLESKELFKALTNPAVKKSEKHNVIDNIFDGQIKNSLKVICDNDEMENVFLILDSFDKCVLDRESTIEALFTYVEMPDEAQLHSIKDIICKKYNKADVVFCMKQDKSLIGGFTLLVDGVLYDKSVKGKVLGLTKHLARR